MTWNRFKIGLKDVPVRFRRPRPLTLQVERDIHSTLSPFLLLASGLSPVGKRTGFDNVNYGGRVSRMLLKQSQVKLTDAAS